MNKQDLISSIEHYVPNKSDRDSVLSAIDDHIKSLTTCELCLGCGYIVETEAECCRNDKECGCCGIPKPIQVQFDCPKCEGIGLISNTPITENKHICKGELYNIDPH